MMQLHLDEISRNLAAGAHAGLLLDRAGWHTTGKLDLPANHADLPAVARPGAQPGRQRLAVSPPEPALKHRLQKLRRHRRRRLQRVAKAHCRARQNHIHRNAPLRSRRSVVMTFGVTTSRPKNSGRRSFGAWLSWPSTRFASWQQFWSGDLSFSAKKKSNSTASPSAPSTSESF